MQKEPNNEQESIDNKLELLKYATKVLSRNIKSDITPDFVMAKFNKEKDKEAIIEMTNNAYWCKRTLNLMIRKPKWKYNSEEKKWTLQTLKAEEKERIYDATNKLFDTFMTRMTMTAILNRNVKNNYILRLIAGLETEEEENNKETEQMETTRIQALLDKFKGRKEEGTAE